MSLPVPINTGAPRRSNTVAAGQAGSASSNVSSSPSLSGIMRHTRQRSTMRVPSSASARSPRGDSEATAAAVKDAAVFASEDFSADDYMRMLLANNSEEGVREHHLTLQQSMDVASSDLQKNVYRNYNEFINISKEISKLETDMLTLRSHLLEIRTVSEGLFELYSDKNDSKYEQNDAESSTKNQSGFAGEDKNLSGAEALAVDFRIPYEGDETTAAQETLGKEEMENVRRRRTMIIRESVEGVEKYLDHGTSRYLIRDEPPLVEVNQSNYSQVKPAHLYLFSDIIIVASPRRSTFKKFSSAAWTALGGITGVKGRISGIVAEKSLPLADIAVVEVKKLDDVKNAFKILVNAESFIFRAETPEAKKAWMSSIKRAIEGLRERQKREQKAKSAAFDNEDAASSAVAEKGKESRSAQNQINGLKEKDVSPEDLEKLQDVYDRIDDLDVFVAQRQFDEAVEFIDSANAILEEYLASQHPLVIQLRMCLQVSKERLANAVGKELGNVMLTKKQVKRNIERLLSLGLAEQARDIFLSARSSVIRYRTKQIKFEGEITSYVEQLSLVLFSLIRNTCDWFRSSFLEEKMTSGFIKWTKREIESFVEIFKRQVFHHQSLSTVADCFKRAIKCCELLHDVGLHFDHLLHSLLREEIAKSIEAGVKRTETTITNSVVSDKWTTVHDLSVEIIITHVTQNSLLANSFLPGPRIGLQHAAAKDPMVIEDEKIIGLSGKSCLDFYDLMNEYLWNVETLFAIPLYPTIVAGFESLFSRYEQGLLDAVSQPNVSEDQLAAIFTASCVAFYKLLPRVHDRIKTLAEREIPEFQSVRAKIAPIHDQIADLHAKRYMAQILNKEIKFQDQDFTEDTREITEAARPSPKILELLSTLKRTYIELESRSGNRLEAIKYFVTQTLRALSGNSFMVTSSGARVFGINGVQQLVLDVRFFLHICDLHLTESAREAAKSILESALRAYCVRSKKDPSHVLKSDEWYDRRISSALNEKGGAFVDFGNLKDPLV